MRKRNLLRMGFYASLSILCIDLTVIFWPYISTYYFLQIAGLFIGIIGSLFFGMALAAKPAKEDMKDQ